MAVSKVDYSLIEGSVRRLYEAKQEKDSVGRYYDQVKKKESVIISNFIFSNIPNQDSFDITLKEGERYYSSHKKLHVTRVRRKKVTWKMEEMKKKLSKEKYKAIITKTYTVTDMEGLTKYLKQCGVDPKKFKKFIAVEQTVNEKSLDMLYETGILSEKELSGCYDVQLSDPYIKISEVKA